ncbi:hypothetical protein [Parabacteroides timonensis]|uniref:hypothetical protein n=1 Tax=Parabacteroides timonensis TaxID=1871013 RepID=UPI00094E51D1|nr:hypothetical protein [Parabacteroides timonensis]
MSMHEIESLVEYSVKTVAAASPTPPLAKSICSSLYQLQSHFDCGYTVLRVREELERLGYLYLLPPEQLPEPERSEAMKLVGKGGFFTKGTYFDAVTNRCYITVDSALYQKLLSLGILPAETSQEIQSFSPLELIEAIAPLASKQSAQDSQVATDTLGLWYGLFPVIYLMTGYDEKPDNERIQKLLRYLATPETFKAAEEYIREVDFEDFADDEELPFCAEWSTPYKDWKERKEDDKTPYNEFCKRMVYNFMGNNEFAEADKYASQIGDENDPARLLHRGMVSIACHQWLTTQEPGTLPPKGLLSLCEAKVGFEYLAGLDLPEQGRTVCRMYILQALKLQGDSPALVELLQQMYNEAIAIVKQRPYGQTKQLQYIALSISYYQMLLENLPDGYLPKKELMRNGLPGLFDLSAIKDKCNELHHEMPQAAETLQQYMEQCDSLMQYIQE